MQTKFKHFSNMAQRVKVFFLFGLMISSVLSVYAQDSIYYKIGVSGIASSGEIAPFWLHSNRFGMYSMSPFSSTNFGEIGKEFKNSGSCFDYGFKANGQLRFDEKGASVYLHEYYAKVRGFGFLDLIVGAREEYLGCQDSILSSGGFLFSTNSRPMPKITIGIEEYTAIPFTKGYIQIKGALVHGWMNDTRYVENTLLHHKYLYVKLGGSFPLNFHYGLNHVVQWGGIHPELGKLAHGFDDYKRMFSAQGGTDENNPNDYNNVQGNHIVSKSYQMDIKFSRFKLSAYWQNLREDLPLNYILMEKMNIADGLWGISLKSDKTPFLSGVLYEFLNTTDQAGPYHDKDGLIYGGSDNYFSNSIYQSGWSYFSRTIGTPLITPPIKTETGYYPYNDRTIVHHIGINGSVYGYNYRFLSSLSRSYGVYSVEFEKVMKCTSLLLEINKTVSQWGNLELACAIAADIGEIPAVEMNIIKKGGNSFGISFSIRKKGFLTSFR